MTTLTITAKGQVTLKKELLQHLGVKPGQKIEVEPTADGRLIVLPARPNLPDDPVIPHNGFQTYEEGEKAFIHLLKKAGVDARWTWDQTMRAIITDPLYKALNTLAEKKAVLRLRLPNLNILGPQ